MTHDYPFDFICHPCVKKQFLKNKKTFEKKYPEVFSQNNGIVTFKRRCKICKKIIDCFGFIKKEIITKKQNFKGLRKFAEKQNKKTAERKSKNAGNH